MPHGLPKWPLSSSVTSSHGSNSSPGSRIVGIHSEGAEQQMKSEAEVELALVGTHLLASPQDCRSLLPRQFGPPGAPGERVSFRREPRLQSFPNRLQPPPHYLPPPPRRRSLILGLELEWREGQGRRSREW